jgi:hypothetical protein
MHSTFQASDSGQAVIRNATAVGTEQLAVTLHPGSDSIIEFQVKDDVPGGLISMSISFNRDSVQQLVDWMRAQGAVD